MNTRRILGIISLVILVFSLAILIYSFLPSELKVNRQNISPQDMELPRRNSLPFFTLLPLGLPPRFWRKRRLLAALLALGLFLSSCAAPTQAPRPTQAPAATRAPQPTAAAVATSLPQPTVTRGALATPTKEPSGGGGVPARPPESRVIELQFPSRLYLGDTPAITLTLKVSPDGTYLTPTAKSPSGVVTTDPIQIENLYDTHNLIAVASLESAGLKVDHAGNWEQPMTLGQEVKWIWTVSADSEGVKTFKILLSLRYVPKKEGETITKPLWVRDFDMEVSKYLFLPLALARSFGLIGFVGGGIGSIIGFPFAKEVLTWVWEKLRGKSKKKK